MQIKTTALAVLLLATRSQVAEAAVAAAVEKEAVHPPLHHPFQIASSTP